MILYVPLIYLQLSGVGFEKVVQVKGVKHRFHRNKESPHMNGACLFLVKKTQMSPTFLSTQGHYLVGWYQHPLRLGSKVTITPLRTCHSRVPQTSTIFYALYVKLLVGPQDPKITKLKGALLRRGAPFALGLWKVLEIMDTIWMVDVGMFIIPNSHPALYVHIRWDFSLTSAVKDSI